MDFDGRRRLNLRFSRNRSVRGGIPERRGVHHGQPVSRQHPKRLDDEIAPLLRHASHELDSEPDLSQQLFDIHCGIRGVTREALDRINITSRGWEYASEMVLKAARLKLISSEVPIKFFKDREGRLSHHLRVGWRSPWLAGWVNLKVMLVYAADSFLLKAGAVLLVIGLVLSLGLAAGPVRIGRIGFSLYWMLLGVTCATLGYSSIQLGVLARVMHGLKPSFVERLQKIMTYDRGMIASAGLGVAGLVLVGNVTYHDLKRGLQREAISQPGILGLLLVILGFQTFGFTLLMEVAKRAISRSRQ